MSKRNGVWYARIKDRAGRWVRRTLNTEDRKVALARYRDVERGLSGAADSGADACTIAQAVGEFLISCRVRGCAPGTISMYEQKAQHLVRVLGSETPLSQVTAPTVDRYAARRLEEQAARNTIGKELTTLRGLLKLARRAGRYDRVPSDVLPLAWSSDYQPRRTTLTSEHVSALLAWLPPRRGALVAFAVGTGARLGEVCRARREDVDLSRGLVYVAITKTRRSGRAERWVPITPLTRTLVEYALAHGRPAGEPLLEPWANVRRDLAQACDAVGAPRATPNDLRRTHANWLRMAGVDTATIADVLGHVDSRMLERVYGKLRPEQLRDHVLRAVR